MEKARGGSSCARGAFRGTESATTMINRLESPLPIVCTNKPIRPNLIFTSTKFKQQAFLAFLMQSHQSEWIYLPSCLFRSFLDTATDIDRIIVILLAGNIDVTECMAAPEDQRGSQPETLSVHVCTRMYMQAQACTQDVLCWQQIISVWDGTKVDGKCPGGHQHADCN